MDLTQHAPRSPFAELGGYLWLPRIIDKAKAKLAGTLGDYRFDCPMDDIFLSFVGLPADTFLDAVRVHQTDEAVLAWLDGRTAKSDSDKRAYADKIVGHKPSADKQAVFETMRDGIAPGRTDVTTWAQLIAIEEGHPIPAVV